MTPPKTQKIGSCTVHWTETLAGDIRIYSEGPSESSRIAAQKVVQKQFEKDGYEKTSSFKKEASWNDIMAKAKRLVQSGNVNVQRNSAQTILANVQGDHGNYDCEISREDPNSRAITQWKCTCPWDQFAWQRTRKWKKYEGRVCAHVLASYWKSHSMPLDEDIHPGVTQGPPPPIPGADPAINSPALPDAGIPSPAGSPQTVPMQGPVTPFNQNPIQAPPQGPAGPDILPQFQGPPAPPAPPPVSIPGVIGPTPEGPIQNPGSQDGMGGTFSKVIESDDSFVKQPDGFQNGNLVQLKNADYGIAEGKSEAHGSGQYREVPANSIGEVMGQDPTTGMVEAIYPLHNSGPLEPYHVRMYHFPSEVTLRPDLKRPGPFRRRR